MGISGQSSFLWRSIELDARLIYYVIEQQFQRAKSSNPSISRLRPKVVIDANLIGYSFLFKGIGPIKAVFVIAKAFARDGIDVTIVCDNKELRHHSKRATISRKGEKERAKIKIIHNRFELTNLLRAADSEAPVNMMRMKKLQKYITTLEHKIDTVFPDNFVEELTKLVNAYDGSITIDATPFQADPDIARRVICGEADVIVSGDSDFAMYIGPDSSDIMIRIDVEVRNVGHGSRCSSKIDP